MGVIIPEATLPSQIKVSNVYASFSNENILVFNNNNGSWRVSSNYRLFSDQTKTNGADIRIPIEVNTTNISVGVYSILYQKIKDIYPDSIDVIYTETLPTASEVVPDKMTIEEYEFGIQTLNEASSRLQAQPELQVLYDAAETNFGINGPATEQMTALRNALDGYIA